MATRMIRLLGRPHADAAVARGNKPWASRHTSRSTAGPVICSSWPDQTGN